MYYFLDTETNGFSVNPQDFRIGVLRKLNGSIFIVDSKSENSPVRAHKILVDKITGLRKYSTVFCHTYDLGVLFGDYIKFFSKKNNDILLGDKFYQGRIDIQKKGKHLRFRNILNLFPNMPLKEVGKLLEIPKHKFPDKFKKGCAWDNITETDIEYCKRDTEIPMIYYEMLSKLCKDYHMNMRLTIPSIALALYDKTFNWMKYNKKEMKHYGRYYSYWGDTKYHHRYYQNEKAILTYRGGISQNFIRGFYDGPIFKYDVNSLYSKAETFKFGIGKIERIDSLKCNLKDYEYGFGCFDIKIPYRHIPQIPFKKSDKDKFILPYGRLNNIWMNITELKHNIEYCNVKLLAIKKLYVALKTEYIFRDFVNEFYKKRFEGSKINKFLYKLIMNSLYGKYAQRIEENKYVEPGDVFELMDIVRGCKDKNIEYEFIEGLDTYMKIKFGKSLGKKDIVHISSNITSYARIIMYNYINKYEDIILYMDTDSLFTTKRLPGYEVDKFKLGKLKFEGRFLAGHILNPKHYILYFDFVHPDNKDIEEKKKKGVLKIKGVKDKWQIKYPTQTKFLDEYVTTLKHSYHLKDYDYLDVRQVSKEYIFDNSKRIFDNDIDFELEYSTSKPIKVNEP